jgi:hypothetical protein
MPYIKQAERELVDAEIEALAAKMRQAAQSGVGPEGLLNYTVTRLIGLTIGEVRYAKIAWVTGVLENIKQEMYRRVAGPYEDSKITENGDLY